MSSYRKAVELLTEHGCEYDHAEFHDMMQEIMQGRPVELSESSPAVAAVNEILNGDCVYYDPDGTEWDMGGSVFWNGPRAVVVW